MDRLLNAKHWQLFLIIFGLPFLIYIGWMISLFSTIINDINYDSYDYPFQIFDNIMYLMLLMLIPMAVQYAWFYSMAIGLQKKLPAEVKMNITLFKVFFYIPVIFVLLYFLGMSFFFGNIEMIEQLEHFDCDPNMGAILAGFMVFMLLSLFIAFCGFYQYWFIAKTIKSAELQKDVRFGEFVGEFFLLWFAFIGVWILQPIVNKLVEEKKELS